MNLWCKRLFHCLMILLCLVTLQVVTYIVVLSITAAAVWSQPMYNLTMRETICFKSAEFKDEVLHLHR